MASNPKHPQVAERDGTSQAGRTLEALTPDYVSVDEQTSAELLSFARAYGTELTYIASDGTPRGDWSDFISANLNLADIANFLRDPSQFNPEESPELFRPHFVLFLAFLKLMEKSRANLNRLTQRHLDYYYRHILHMGNKPSIPDRVNLVVNLAPSGSAVLVPRGAELNAGPDVSGVDRIYKTDRDIIVNRAQISRMSSLFLDRRRTTLRQAPKRFPNDKQRAVQAMMEITLGSPLPLYPDGTVLDIPKLYALRDYLLRAEIDFYLSLSELRDLMTRRSLRPAPPAEWREINRKLEAAGRTKRGQAIRAEADEDEDDGLFIIDRYSQDFYTNIELAVGPIDLSTLAGVNIVDDLADLRTDETVADFILEKLYFANVDDFARMILLKRKFVNEWAQINAILELAGQRKLGSSTYTLPTTDITDFATNVQTAMGVPLATLQTYWDNVIACENYFYMAAELLIFAAEEVITVPQDEWEQIFTLLEEGHKEKRRRERKAALRSLREATPAGRLIDLVRLALGEPPAESEDATAFDRLVPYLGQTDADKLDQLSKDGNWERIYSLLELAQRNREGEPLAESTEWLNLYPAEDATKVEPTRSVKLEDESASGRFAAFGVARPIPTPEPVPNPVIGWGLSTPLLKLSEGERVITLTLGFDTTETALPEIFVKDGELSVLFEISTVEGFVACETSTPVFGDYAALCAGSSEHSPQGARFVITLPATFPAIAAPPEALVDANNPWPVLRVLMRPLYSYEYQQHIARYPALSQLELLAVHVEVEVSGLQTLQIQNDDATLDPKRPFEPFGSTPLVGSRFMIGHPEIVAKRLDGLVFDFQWMGAPDNLSTHYVNYGFGSSGPTFTTKVTLIDGPRRVTLAQAAALFGATGSTPATIAIDGAPFTDARDMSPAPLAKDAEPLDDDLANWERFVIWELNSPDFQHTNYPDIVTERSLALTVASSSSGTSSINAADYKVKVPYTPKLKSISVGYSSSLELRCDNLNRDTRIHRVLHIHPFGACAAETERTGMGVPFLPPYDNDGELYIGLSEVVAPQGVSIFIQVAEGSADADLKPQPISWSYLDGDRWISLARHVQSDTTRGLCNSGIIDINLPAAQPSSRIRANLYWIRATIPRDTVGICDIVGVHTQGVAATFIDRGNAKEHFRDPLPAGTIQQLVNRIPLVAGITQPYTSYGGRMAEDPALFNTRVSERLRHKGRALSIWDYERLILDRFPELHKVKCIPARPEKPGAVTIIVIPDIRNKVPFEPFEPKAPANLLGEITDYVNAKAPACAEIEVKNAHYVSVRIRLGVRFRGTGNEAFYKQQLIDDINRFLSPWAYDEGADIAIGGRIYASTLVDFVDRRPYVDYVAGIKLFRSDDGQTFRPVARPPAGSQEGYFVETERPDAVLVAARSHLIDVLSDAAYEEKLITGIGFMKLELDFSVTEG